MYKSADYNYKFIVYKHLFFIDPKWMLFAV